MKMIIRGWVVMKCLSNDVFVFFHDEKKKKKFQSIYKEKKSFIYDLQVVPINCDYEILSPLM